MKLLIVLRVSTDSQDVESQKSEMISYGKSIGYTQKDLIILEGIGASAVKLNKRYQELVDKITELVESRTVNAVAVWHLNRLGRNETVLMQLKELFIKHKCQFICLNPTLKLLNDDLSVNAGADLAYSLFATMSKQDDLERKEKFKRAKKFNAENCKFSGGTVKYGYMVDASGKLIPNEEEADNVRKIFELYSTGNYSTYSLHNECRSLGIMLSHAHITKIIKDTTYIGRKDEGNIHRNAIPIVSIELFNKCKSVREKNKFKIRGEKVLASGLIICEKCGGTFCSHGRYYACSRHIKGKANYCEGKIMLEKRFVDHILLDASDRLYEKFKKVSIQNYFHSLAEERNSLADKIINSNKLYDELKKKYERICESYIEGMINKQSRDKRIKTLNEEINALSRKIDSYQNRLETISPIILSIFNGSYKGDDVSIDDDFQKVHKMIKMCTIKKLGLDDYLFTITGFDDSIIVYQYIPSRGKRKYSINFIMKHSRQTNEAY